MSNVSVFVPHNGCPNQCSFCNQFCITNQVYQPTEADVDNAVRIALDTMGNSCKDTEIAFFGGSFTAIDCDYMIYLLEAACKYVKNGLFRGIRVSTRPDAIDKNKLDILKTYCVTTVELGAQSMCDDVLNANRRGHDAESVINAAHLIKEYGFDLGLQMMTGLYKDSNEKSVFTCRKFIEIKPSFVRIYPTIVLNGTYLEELYKTGEYVPQTVDEAVELCCQLLDEFDSAGIPVIRLGLHSIDTSGYVAGPWHSAFGELCQNRRILKRLLSTIDKPGKYVLHVNPAAVSKTVGHKRVNVNKLKEIGADVKIVTDSALEIDEIIVEEVEN